MIFKHFLGEISFKANGDNSLRFLNTVRDCDFKCKNLYCKNDSVSGIIYGTNYKKINEIASNNYMNIEIVKKEGLIYRILPYKKRLGLIFGLLFSVIIVFLLSNTTLKIRIISNNEQLNNEILSVLKLNGVEPGKFIPGMDFNQVERSILTTLKDVSWVSIRSSGGIIIVDITQTTQQPYIVPQRLPCNIISTHDAQIINVEVYAGQLMALIGDGVKKGDLIVSGFVVDKNNKPTYYHAQAKIIGEYEETVEFTQLLNEEVKIVSDKNKKRNYFDFFSIKIPLTIGNKVTGEYSYTERTNQFSLFTLKLPLGISHCTYKPFEIINYNYTVEEAKNKLDEKIKIYEENFLQDCIIINRVITEKITDTSVNYSVLYVLQGDIAQTNEILVKN